LETIEDCLPKPAKHFIPEWFKDIPSNDNASVKFCPSFPDYFSQGYIVPMWCDTKLQYDKEEDAWSLSTSSNLFSLDAHGNKQFLNYKKANFNGVDGQFVFKANCPWRVVTPPGWSVLQLPLFYHFNQEWSILPGVIDTDVHHEINQQILYHGNGKSIDLKSGSPFVLYVPFKRSNKLKLNVRYQNEDDKKTNQLNKLKRVIKFPPTGYYRELQRLRDKDLK
jgi:hypothetical protein